MANKLHGWPACIVRGYIASGIVLCHYNALTTIDPNFVTRLHSARPGFLVLLLLTACATTKTPTASTQATEAQILMDDAAGEVMIVEVAEERPPVSSNPNDFQPIKSIQYNPRYTIAGSINDKYDLFWERDSPNKNYQQGIVDKSGNVILPNIFSKGYGTVNNYEVVLSINSFTYGLYNVNELRWTIPVIYHDLSSMGNSLFSVRLDNKWGVIDNNNSVVVPFQWNQIQRIGNLENYILVSVEDVWGVFSIVERKLVIPCEYPTLRKLDNQSLFMARRGNSYNLIDINNVPVFKTWYEDIRTSRNNPDYYIVKRNNRFGVIDSNEKVIIPIEYLEFSDNNYSDGSYLARNKDGKYGFILIDGRITLPFKYDNLKRGSNNSIVSVLNGRCGLVQVNAGAPFEIVTCDFDNIRENSKTFIVEKGGKFGLLNQQGKQITATEYDFLESFKEGYYDDVQIYVARKGKNMLLLNEQGRVISDPDFIEITPLHRRTQSYYSPRFTYLKAKAKNGNYGIVDKVGKTIVQPQFEDIVSEDENMFIVRLKGKCGIYSLLSQKMIVDFEYEQIVKANSNYIGFSGRNIDFLFVKSDQVSKMSTIR